MNEGEEKKRDNNPPTSKKIKTPTKSPQPM